ncbi:hypothetical protein ACFV9D_24555 [Streptomyces sp. NPDC059875]|uniref:hypothetical protein n=1 Tax=unclassified Streptomyces TaxID=2593676 RepID=UPI00365515C5
MTPRRRRGAGGGRRAQRNEAARLTDQLLAEGFNKKQVGEILGRNPSLVSQVFTKNKGASMVEALRAVVQEVQAGGPRSVESLTALAAAHIEPRQTREGKPARVRSKDVLRAEKTVGKGAERHKEWTSSLAQAGKQHIASGASRLYPVVEEAARYGGRIAFTVRAKKKAYKHDAGLMADSPGVRRNVVKRPDSTEERSYGNNVGGPGSSEEGFDAVQFKAMVDAAGDVAAAVHTWLVATGRLDPDAVIVHLEIRAWKPREY